MPFQVHGHLEQVLQIEIRLQEPVGQQEPGPPPPPPRTRNKGRVAAARKVLTLVY
jgi:hypothetical protein